MSRRGGKKSSALDRPCPSCGAKRGRPCVIAARGRARTLALTADVVHGARREPLGGKE